MISIIHRHVLKEILVATGMAMALFVFVLLVGNALRDIVQLLAAGKLSLAVCTKLLLLLIPYVTAYALPLGMLAGTLIAVGRLAADQEITAMKSAGLSLYHIATPVFLITLVAMVFGVLVNLHYGPQSRLAYKQLMASAISENPLGFIEAKRFIYDFKDYVIYMGAREGQQMQDFWIWELDEHKRVKLFLRAAEGALELDPVENQLILRLKNGMAEKRSDQNPEDFISNPVRSLYFGELPIALSLDKILGSSLQRRVRLKEMTFAQLMQQRQQVLERTADRDPRKNERLMALQVHLQKNFAMAFSVFSLAVFGIPLAIHVGRKETYANLGLALVIAMVYYFMMIMASWFERAPQWRPDWLVWVPNFLFQAVGFTLLRRSNKR